MTTVGEAGICWFASLATLASGLNGRDVEANFSDVLDLFFKDRGAAFYQYYRTLPEQQRVPDYLRVPYFIDFKDGAFGTGTIWFERPYIIGTLTAINAMLQPLGIRLDYAFMNEMLAHDVLSNGIVERMIRVVSKTNEQLASKIIERRMAERLMDFFEMCGKARKGIIFSHFAYGMYSYEDGHAVALDGTAPARDGKAVIVHDMNLDGVLEIPNREDPDRFLSMMGIPRSHRRPWNIYRNYTLPAIIVGSAST